jgi:predicted Fe-Mo cluster-binding NifX family protein
MKIAVITEDGKTISQHFGRAPHYLVFTVENGEITHTEQRSKAGHQQFVTLHDHDHDHEHGHGQGQGHGFGAGDDAKHNQMVAPIADCEVLLVRGMGRGAHIAVTQANIRPIITVITDAEQAVRAYLDGSIVDHPEKLH